MTEPTDNKEDIMESLNNINRNFEEKIAPMSETLGNLSAKVDNLETKDSKVDNRDPFNFHIDGDDNDSDGEYVTKGDLKTFGESIGQSLLDKTDKRTDKRVDEKIELKSNKGARDYQTLQKFKMFDESSPQFDAKFQKEVHVEVQRRLGNGRSADDVDLLYDSCNAIQRHWEDTGQYVPKEKAEHANRQMNNSEDNFAGGSGGFEPSGKPNASQIAMGERWGMNKEELTQRMKNNKENQG